MRRIITVASAMLLALALTVPAGAHEPKTPDATDSSRRDHFIEHLLRSDLEIDQNFGNVVRTEVYGADTDGDGNAEGDTDDPFNWCLFGQPPPDGGAPPPNIGGLSDLNQAVAQTDLDSDSDVDADDDQFLIDGICYYYLVDVVRGQDNGKFGVGQHTRRDQGSSFVARWVDFHNDGVRDGDFPEMHVTDYPDVSQQNAHSGAIWWLSQGGGGFQPPIFQGFPNGDFEPASFLKNQHGSIIGERLVDNFG